MKKENPGILIVEDEVFLAETIGARLEFLGYQVAYAENGQEALEKLKSNLPDLILMDALMPVMDGFEATHLIKADPRLKNIPVVFLTALAGPGDKEKAIASGAEDYLVKPFEVADLISLIKKWAKN